MERGKYTYKRLWVMGFNRFMKSTSQEVFRHTRGFEYGTDGTCMTLASVT